LKYFRKKIGENIGFFAQLLIFCKKVIITGVFEKDANFFAENWQISRKIVIITSTPDWAKFRRLGYLSFTFGGFYEKGSPHLHKEFSPSVQVMYKFCPKNELHFGQFFTDSSGHPVAKNRIGCIISRPH
jgi:hypothetical protein